MGEFMNFTKKIVKRVRSVYNLFEPLTSKCIDDNIFAIAGQSAFFIILSAVPLIMFIVSLLQNFKIPVEYLQRIFLGFFSENMTDQLISFLTDAYANTVGISLITLIITLWSAAQGIHALTNGLNRIYDAYENRNWLYRRLRAMLYTVALFVIILVSIVIIILGSSINHWLSPYLKYVPDIVTTIYNLRYILVFFAFVSIFAVIFRNFPNVTREEHKEYGIKSQLPGAFLCTVSWYVLSFGISIYVDDFNGFSVYGGLTRLAVMMVWLYFCMVCLMVCAEINYVYHDKIKAISSKKIFRAKK